MSKRIIIVTTVLLTVILNNFRIILAINGVATEKVVAVPAKRANKANKSIILISTIQIQMIIWEAPVPAVISTSIMEMYCSFL